MHRRQVLYSSGIALSALPAGCVGGDGDDPEDDAVDGRDQDADPAPDPDDNGADEGEQPGRSDPDVATLPDDGPTPPEDLEERFTIFEDEELGLVGSIPTLQYLAGDRITVDVRVVSEPDADGPLTIGAWVENEGSVPEHLRPSDIPPFDAPRDARIDGYADREPERSGARGTLFLRATSASPFIDEDPTVHRDRDGVWRPPSIERHSKHPDRIRIDPGETLYGEFVVLAPRGSGDIQSGVYDVSFGDPGFPIIIWERNQPGPLEPSQLAATDVPDLDDGGTRWFHDTDRGTETYLYPTAERVATPAEITFTFVNHSRGTVSGNPYGWALYKLVDGEWFKIAPSGVPVPLMFVSPGGHHSWTRRVFDGPGLHRGPEISESVSRTDRSEIGHLGGGQYAMEVSMSAEDGRAAALFELESDPTVVTPTADLEIVSDEPEGLVLEDRLWRHRDEGRRQILSLRAADGDAGAADRRLIAEQVMQPENHGLRNLLAHRDAAAEEIRLRTNRNVMMIGLRWDEDDAVIAFEDGVYRIEGVEP